MYGSSSVAVGSSDLGCCLCAEGASSNVDGVAVAASLSTSEESGLGLAVVFSDPRVLITSECVLTGLSTAREVSRGILAEVL